MSDKQTYEKAALVRPTAPIQVDESVHVKVQQWLGRGDIVAVFENKAMDSATLGHQLFMPIGREDLGKAEVGRSRAPDGRHGLGWKYVLTFLTDQPGDFQVA